jgi:hypothetical protein
MSLEEELYSLAAARPSSRTALIVPSTSYGGLVRRFDGGTFGSPKLRQRRLRVANCSGQLFGPAAAQRS